MKYTMILFLLICGLSLGTAQGIDFFHGSWEEALAKAKAEDKLIFVDAYTTWCGPCKRMSANVFPDERVGSYYNQNFVSLKLDMEKAPGREFQKTFPVSAYPTLFYIDADGKLVEKVRGALPVDRFIAAGQTALAKLEASIDYASEYEAGKRDPEFIYRYIRSQIRSGESHLKIANDYLRDRTDLDQPDNLRIILLSSTETDSRIFDLLLKYQTEVINEAGLEAFQTAVWQAGMNTAAKATEFAMHDLLEAAWKKVEEVYPARADEFRLSTEMTYTLQHQDAKGFMKASKEYVKKVADDDPTEWEKQAKLIANNFHNDSKAMDMAEGLAKDAAQRLDNYQGYYTYATILNQQGKKQEALDAANQSLQLAQESGGGAVRMVQFLIRNIEKA